MSKFQDELKYAPTHEWVKVNGDGTVTIGISDHAQTALGDIVFIELPETGTQVSVKDEIAVVESVKAASDVYAPVSGEVIEVNDTLTETPETVNSSPYEDGWFIKIQLSDEAELEDLLDVEAYRELCEEE